MGRLLSFIVVVLLIASFPLRVEAAVDATLTFDKTTVSANVGDTISVNLLINAGSNQVTSSDVNLTYDSTLFTAQAVTSGSYFTNISQDLSTGKVYVGGYMSDVTVSKTGSGTVATVTFKVLGSGVITLDCANSKIIDKTTLNSDLSCASPVTLTVTASGATTSTTTPTPTTTASTSTTTPTPTIVPIGAGTTSTLSPTPPTALPRTGAFEDLLPIGIVGIGLLVVGGAGNLSLRRRV